MPIIKQTHKKRKAIKKNEAVAFSNADYTQTEAIELQKIFFFVLLQAEDFTCMNTNGIYFLFSLPFLGICIL